ncbi:MULTISPECIES: universal stress protein [Planctopirus]|nr:MULTISPECIES: universal stress protein [Planctopirus]
MMIRLERILFPTDFSDFALPAQQYAAELANRLGSTLHLLNVVQDIEMISPDPASPFLLPTGQLPELMAATQENLNSLAKPLQDTGLQVVTAVRSGVPFLEILQYAEEQAIDLIVLGTHGRTGLAHVLLGSTAERITRKSPCPVLTVRPQALKAHAAQSEA